MIAPFIAPLARAAMTRDWLVRLIARGRSEGVDRQLAAALELSRLLPKLETMRPVDARRFAAGSLADTTLPRAAMAAVTDVPVGRVFTPADPSGDLIVYLHGGGGVIGSIEECEPVARYLAARTRCTVAVPAYRLAPEAKHPAAIVDACAGWDALASTVPANRRVIVAGDSFGAFLAAHVERHARASGQRRPDLQVLIYPLLDLTLQSPSVERFASGYLLTRPIMEWFRDHYSNPDDDHAANSPWYWSDLQRTAPALIVTAGHDPLVDEGIGWVERLREAGTPVRHHHHESLIHSFLSLAGVVRAARLAVDMMCRRDRRGARRGTMCDLRFVLHGGIILMLSQLGGFVFARAIRSGDSDRWRMSHAACSAGGVLLIALAPVAPHLAIGTTLLASLWIGSTYALCVGTVVAAITGRRGIESGGPPMNQIVYALV